MIRLPDLTDPAPLERAAKVISAFRSRSAWVTQTG
jgi:hypothetical protein